MFNDIALRPLWREADPHKTAALPGCDRQMRFFRCLTLLASQQSDAVMKGISMEDYFEKRDDFVSARFRRLLLSVALVFLIALGGGGITIALYVADIRPQELKKGYIAEAAASEGKELLLKAANMHGIQRWNLHSNLEILAIDEWLHWAGRAFINPFPNARQEIRFQQLIGTWTSRVELLDASGPTEVWGIQAWKTYRSQVGQSPVFQSDDAIRFFLPTFQWWFEFPFRIASATVIAALGDSPESGVHRVFVTWGTLEPNREVDQYIVHINKETGLIDRIEYTIRDMGWDGSGFAAGATNYLDYRAVDGVMVPFQFEASAMMPGGFEQVMHRVTVASAGWDTVTPDLLLPNPDLVSEEDSKP